jgi:CheY-like chemotaxis protein
MEGIQGLAGRRVLLVEDEYFIADDMAQGFREKGTDIVGPAATVADALDLIAKAGQLDGAVLDINLRGEMVFPVADALEARKIPFLFATGYDQAVIPLRFRHIVRCEKPLELAQVARILFLDAHAS